MLRLQMKWHNDATEYGPLSQFSLFRCDSGAIGERTRKDSRRSLVPASRHDCRTCTVTSDLAEQPIDPANSDGSGKGAGKDARATRAPVGRTRRGGQMDGRAAQRVKLLP